MSLSVRGEDTHPENFSAFCKSVMQSEILGGAASAGKQAILNGPFKVIDISEAKKKVGKNGELKKNMILVKTLILDFPVPSPTRFMKTTVKTSKIHIEDSNLLLLPITFLLQSTCFDRLKISVYFE